MPRQNAQSERKGVEGPRLDPVLDFMRLLWSIEHALQRTSKRMEATVGVTGPQRLVLRIVSKTPGLSAGALARTIHLHPSTVTGIVQRLVRKGLLGRERDPHDNRRVRLHARARSRVLTAASNGTVEAAIRRALARLPARRVQNARGVLAAIAEALANNDTLESRPRVTPTGSIARRRPAERVAAHGRRRLPSD